MRRPFRHVTNKTIEELVRMPGSHWFQHAIGTFHNVRSAMAKGGDALLGHSIQRPGLRWRVCQQSPSGAWGSEVQFAKCCLVVCVGLRLANCNYLFVREAEMNRCAVVWVAFPPPQRRPDCICQMPCAKCMMKSWKGPGEVTCAFEAISEAHGASLQRSSCNTGEVSEAGL